MTERDAASLKRGEQFSAGAVTTVSWINPHPLEFADSLGQCANGSAADDATLSADDDEPSVGLCEVGHIIDEFGGMKRVIAEAHGGFIQILAQRHASCRGTRIDPEKFEVVQPNDPTVAAAERGRTVDEATPPRPSNHQVTLPNAGVRERPCSGSHGAIWLSVRDRDSPLDEPLAPVDHIAVAVIEGPTQRSEADDVGGRADEGQ